MPLLERVSLSSHQGGTVLQIISPREIISPAPCVLEQYIAECSTDAHCLHAGFQGSHGVQRSFRLMSVQVDAPAAVMVPQVR